jgi:molybdate transport system permease protein
MTMWPSADESQALQLSLSVALRSVLFSLPLALSVAWLLTRRRFLGRTLLDAFVHLPLVLPPVMVGYVLLLLLGSRGPIGGWLQREFGIQLIFTRNGAAVATAVMSFPLMVRAMRLSLETVERGLEEAARTLGAGAIDRFATITLPLMLPGLLAGAVTAFSAALGEFGAVITFVSNIPGETRTLPLALYTALQTPGGEPPRRLAVISFVLGLGRAAVVRMVRAARAPPAGPLMFSWPSKSGAARSSSMPVRVADPGRGRAVRPLGQRQKHLVHIVAGLLDADAGRVVLDDLLILDTANRRQRAARAAPHRGGIPGLALVSPLSVAGNLNYGRKRAAPPFFVTLDALPICLASVR